MFPDAHWIRIARHLREVGHADDLMVTGPSARALPSVDPSRPPPPCRSRRRPEWGCGRPASTVLTAKVRRDNSPPEAILRNGRGSSPSWPRTDLDPVAPASGRLAGDVAELSGTYNPEDCQPGTTQAQGLKPPLYGPGEVLGGLASRRRAGWTTCTNKGPGFGQGLIKR